MLVARLQKPPNPKYLPGILFVKTFFNLNEREREVHYTVNDKIKNQKFTVTKRNDENKN